MRFDRYAQDELLNEVNDGEIKGIGADLYLGNWDPDRGTWDDIQIVPNDGTPSIPIRSYDEDDTPPWEAVPPPVEGPDQGDDVPPPPPDDQQQ